MQRKSWSIHMYAFSKCVTNAYVSLIHLLNKMIAPTARVTIWGSSLEREHCAQTKNTWNLVAYFACCLFVTCITFFPFRVFFYESYEYKLAIKSKSSQLTFKLELDTIAYNPQWRGHKRFNVKRFWRATHAHLRQVKVPTALFLTSWCVCILHGFGG